MVVRSARRPTSPFLRPTGCCTLSPTEPHPDRETRGMLSPDEFWKYAGVFGALVAAGFGAPIPEELPIATGGVLVGRDWNNPDGLKWWIMLPLCILGVVLCDTFLYCAGRKWGRQLISLPWVQRRLMSPERFHKIEKNFHDY